VASSTAATVAGYLASLPPDRRAVVAKVRAAVRRAMPKGYKEAMGYGIITWAVPLSVLPETYNGEPLCYVALAAQKHYYALYLMGPYGDPSLLKLLKQGYQAAGLKLDMGKSCVRFKGLDGIALDVVADVIARVPLDAYVARYQAIRQKR
jgi:hypothetical protein